MLYEDFRDGVNVLVEELTRKDKFKEVTSSALSDSQSIPVGGNKASCLVTAIRNLVSPPPPPVANE